MRIKICGVTSASELALLDRHRVDFAGLWWKVPQGAHNVSTEDLLDIAMTASSYTRPMLVTLGAPLNSAIDVLLRTGIHALQLHGFELPGAVARLKAVIPDLQLFKTLHIRSGQCLEQTLVKAYRDAGVDVFIADTFLSRDALGSTGIAVPEAALERLLAATEDAPVMLAGGVNTQRIAVLKGRSGLWGVDIDSAARVGGRINAQAVAELVAALAVHEKRMHVTAHRFWRRQRSGER